jgi:hypothetical protein
MPNSSSSVNSGSINHDATAHSNEQLTVRSHRNASIQPAINHSNLSQKKVTAMLKGVVEKKPEHQQRTHALYKAFKAGTGHALQAFGSPMQAVGHLGEVVGIDDSKAQTLEALVRLNAQRKSDLDLVISLSKAKVRLHDATQHVLKKTLDSAMLEADGLGHELALHQSFLMMRKYVLGYQKQGYVQRPMAEKEEIIKQNRLQLNPILNLLVAVPFGHPVGLGLSTFHDAHSMQVVAVDLFNLNADRQLEVILYDLLDLSRAPSDEWPIMGQHESIQGLRKFDSRQAVDSTTALGRLRDHMDRLFEKKLFTEIFTNLMHEVILPSSVESDLMRKESLLNLEAGSLALSCAHDLLVRQVHFPASIGRILEMHADLSYYLIFKVSPNLNKLAEFLKSALEKTPSCLPENLLPRLNERMLERLSGEPMDWTPHTTTEQNTSKYLAMIHLFSVFTIAENQLSALSVQVYNEAKGVQKAKAFFSIYQLSRDLHVNVGRIKKHMSELVALGIDTKQLDEATINKISDRANKELDWTVSPISLKAVLHVEESARGKLVNADKKAKRMEGIEKNLAQLDRLIGLHENHARDCLQKLEQGNVNVRFSSSTVKASLTYALNYKKDQIFQMQKVIETDEVSPAFTALMELKSNRLKSFESSMHKDIAKAVSLRPTLHGINEVIGLKMKVDVSQPVLLPFTQNQENDFVHEYIFTIEGFKFKLHIHYPSPNLNLTDKPLKSHFKRLDEKGFDDVQYPSLSNSQEVLKSYRSQDVSQVMTLVNSLIDEALRLPTQLLDRRERVF